MEDFKDSMSMYLNMEDYLKAKCEHQAKQIAELKVFKEVVVNITRSVAFKNLAIDKPDVYSALINEMKLLKEINDD